MKYIGIVFIVLICLQACDNKKAKSFVVPSTKEMAIIIADIHVAEATMKEKSSSILAKEQIGGFNYTLKKYGLEKEEFDSAIAYYSAQPAVYQQIYEDVLVILTEKEMSARALNDDSIKASIQSKDTLNVGERSIWKNDSLLIDSSQDSSKLQATFSHKVDSIFGGKIVLRAKYKFRSIKLADAKYKMRLFAIYSDSTKDSSEVAIAYTNLPKEFTTEISLKSIQLKEVSGTLITSESTKPYKVEITGINLDWKKSVSKIE